MGKLGVSQPRRTMLKKVGRKFRVLVVENLSFVRMVRSMDGNTATCP